MDDPLRRTLADLAAFLQANQVPYALIGGIAVSVRGEPRFTADVDVVAAVDVKRGLALLEATTGSAFEPLFAGAGEVVETAYILPLRHRTTAIKADVAIGLTGFERNLVAHSVPVDLGGFTVAYQSIKRGRRSMRMQRLFSYAVVLSAGVFLGRLPEFAPVKVEVVAGRGGGDPRAAAVFNIKQSDFGAAGNGVTDDTSAIQTAINAAVSAGGGTVYFPAGAYYTSAPLIINGSSVHLAGEGRASSLDVHGSFDSILINTTSSPQGQYGNSIRNLRLSEYNKLGGRSIAARLVAQLHIADVIIDSPFDGIHLHNFNDVNIERTRVAGPRGTFGGLLTGGGTSDGGRSDVIDFQDVVFSGTKALQDRHGLIIDGFVSTVSAHKIYFTAVDGVGLWIRNTIGASQNPEFATFYGLEADFPYYEAIQIQQGQRFYFTDTQVHGSRNRSNIFIADGVRTLSFKGGFSSGARNAGMDIFGRQVIVSGMEFLSNSAPPSGGSAGAWAGLVLEGSSRIVTVFGNQSGDPVNPTWQSYGIQINSGADQFAITGNVLFNNAQGGLLNGAGTGPTRVMANNAMPEGQ